MKTTDRGQATVTPFVPATEANPDTSGPASFVIVDPDGNPILDRPISAERELGVNDVIADRSRWTWSR